MSATIIYIILGVIVVGLGAYWIMNKKKGGSEGPKGPSMPPEGPTPPPPSE